MKIGDTVIERNNKKPVQVVDTHKLGYVIENAKGYRSVRRGDELKEMS